MNNRQKTAIENFASAITELNAAGVIRSHRYLGDIAEFLCADAFDIVLSDNLREEGHDGMRDDAKVQVKYGGGKKTNVDLGNPDEYQEIYIVLGRESVVRTKTYDEDFVVYKLTSDEVRTMCTPSGNYSCGRGPLSREPDLRISMANLIDVAHQL
ncbi:MAG: DUF6998 domain-containing protein [Thiobacillus sp.]